MLSGRPLDDVEMAFYQPPELPTTGTLKSTLLCLFESCVTMLLIIFHSSTSATVLQFITLTETPAGSCKFKQIVRVYNLGNQLLDLALGTTALQKWLFTYIIGANALKHAVTAKTGTILQKRWNHMNWYREDDEHPWVTRKA